MKVVNSIKFSVFVKEGEDEDAIKEKLLDLIDLDLEKEKIEIKKFEIFQLRKITSKIQTEMLSIFFQKFSWKIIIKKIY